MAGTYLQQDVYGSIPHAAPLFNAATMNDQQLIDLVQAVPAVAHARRSCNWILVTSLYQPKPAELKPPATNTSECWLAFVDREDHSTPGWIKIPLVLFHSYERNENFVKVMLPAVLSPRPSIFVNHALPQARCLALPHLIRAKELSAGDSSQPHLLASKIPSWSGRSKLPGHLEMTQGYLERRNATEDMVEFQELLHRMARSGFNTSQPLPVTDTLWMIWPLPDKAAERMSRLWTHEVARHSSHEKASYAWVVSRVPDFRPRLTDAFYIYSSSQRMCGGGAGNLAAPTSGKNAPRKKKRRLGGRARRLLAGVHVSRAN